MANIYGGFSANSSASGGFFLKYYMRSYVTSNSDNVYDSYKIGLDLSKGNPIYGASTTVQPNSYTVYYIIKIK